MGTYAAGGRPAFGTPKMRGPLTRARTATTVHPMRALLVGLLLLFACGGMDPLDGAPDAHTPLDAGDMSGPEPYCVGRCRPRLPDGSLGEPSACVAFAIACESVTNWTPTIAWNDRCDGTMATMTLTASAAAPLPNCP